MCFGVPGITKANEKNSFFVNLAIIFIQLRMNQLFLDIFVNAMEFMNYPRFLNVTGTSRQCSINRINTVTIVMNWASYGNPHF